MACFLVSNVIDIGLSIVQGSGTGPKLYIVMKNDFCTVSAVNHIFFAFSSMLMIQHFWSHSTPILNLT